MKWALATVTIIALAISIIPNSYAAIPKAGAKCSKAGATSTYTGKKYTCVKSGRKLVWNKGVKFSTPTPTATPSSTSTANPFAAARDKAAAGIAAADKAAAGITCPVNGKCEIGNKGPGGGIVFYVAPTPQSWGQYLEVAPVTWNHTYTDPEATWCGLEFNSLVSTVKDPELKKLIGTEIGKGRGNTQLMTAFCKSGAANLATAYRGGGKSDWFLPSKDELNQLCRYASGQTQITAVCDSTGTLEAGGTLKAGFAGTYWSSSETDENVFANSAWTQYSGNGGQGGLLKLGEGWPIYVRPIRAFS
jgi:hypothetical protein